MYHVTLKRKKRKYLETNHNRIFISSLKWTVVRCKTHQTNSAGSARG